MTVVNTLHGIYFLAKYYIFFVQHTEPNSPRLVRFKLL